MSQSFTLSNSAAFAPCSLCLVFSQFIHFISGLAVLSPGQRSSCVS